MPEERYRVLFVSSHPVQYAAPIFRLMAQHPQLDIQVAYCSLQGAEAGTDPEFGVEVKWDIPLLEGYPWVHVPNGSLRPGLGRFFGLVNPGLWRLIRSGNFDAVVVYAGYLNISFWIVAAAARIRQIPILFGTDATGLEPRSRSLWKAAVKRKILPEVFRMAGVSLAPSAATRDYLISLNIPPERIIVTPFVVDNDFWTTKSAEVDRAKVRAAWGISGEQSVILFCAKLQPWKRPQDVVRAFAKAGLPGSVLVMAGEGPMRLELEAEAEALGVADRVRFKGFVNQSQLPALYCAADAMVLSSEYDPCPVVICEAMLCGCPVILSDAIKGRRELVRPGETGFVYRCGDVDALAEAINLTLSDPEKQRQLSRAARQRMETWSPRQNIEAHIRALGIAINRNDKNCSSETPDLQPRLRA